MPQIDLDDKEANYSGKGLTSEHLIEFSNELLQLFHSLLLHVIFELCFRLFFDIFSLVLFRLDLIHFKLLLQSVLLKLGQPLEP